LRRRWGVTIAAVSLVALSQIGYESLTLVPMIGLGIPWASMIGLPPMMVSTTLPKKQTGVYLGVLNMMIVIPTLAETLTFGWIFKNLLGGSGSTAILLSGILLGCAGRHRLWRERGLGR
jgi:maltose/moltooligosaccharide transporter